VKIAKDYFSSAVFADMSQEFTPEEQTAVDDAELQEAMYLEEVEWAKLHADEPSPYPGEFRTGPSQEALRPSKAAFDCWLSFFPELKDSPYASRGLLGRIYMRAWESGASEMLDWLQAEASTGSDPLKNIGSFDDLFDYGS
jgi:hypothetical protein